MLGTHPHYRLRYPETQEQQVNFTGESVETLLEQQGRSLWTRILRNEYDYAMYYHDRVLAESLRTLQIELDQERAVSWLYLSDHGQEVGHSKDRAGHSGSTLSGYEIPLILWDSDERFDAELEKRSFRGDWLTQMLVSILAIDWQERDSTRDVLADNYKWQRPDIPKY